MDEVRELAARIGSEELAVLESRRTALRSTANRTLLMILGGAFVALVMGGGAAWSMHRHARAREAAQAALRTLNAALEASNEELNALAHAVSHELRAPVRTLDGFSAALLQDYGEKLDAEGKDMLRRVRGASRRLGARVDAMLTLSRLARREMNVERVNMSSLAQSVADSLRRAAPERHGTCQRL